MRKLLSVSSALALLFVFPTTAFAQAPENFGAHLTGAEEVPPRDTLAQGQVALKLVSPNTITYRLIASNIENVVGAHIHCGDPGVSGPIVQFLMDNAAPGGGRHDGVLATGQFDPSASGSCQGMGLVEAMRAGHTYVNVHTNDGADPPDTGAGDFPGGEIRGQIRVNG